LPRRSHSETLPGTSHMAGKADEKAHVSYAQPLGRFQILLIILPL